MTELCYSALPIDLTLEDQGRITKNRGDDTTNGTTGVITHVTGYFLEPHTRRLTFWGTHMPCVQNFGGAYLNTRGGWVVALPHLLLMETPQTLQQHERIEYHQGVLRPYEDAIGSGGIYPEDLVRAMEKFSQTSRLRDNVGVLLADQGSRFANPSHISPHDLWQEIPVVSFNFLGWLGDLLDHWGTMLAALTLLLVCIKALSFASGLLARCLAAHRIWGCQLHLLAAVLPSVLQWMAIQLGLRGAWPAIDGEDPTTRETESFLTHARRSVMRDRLVKRSRTERTDCHHEGGPDELSILGTKRKEPTGCDSIIDIPEAGSFGFTAVPMGSAISPAAFHQQQLARHQDLRTSTIINQRFLEQRVGHTGRGEEGFPDDVVQNAVGGSRSPSPGAESEGSGNGTNPALGCP
jgi:hypothetical protein